MFSSFYQILFTSWRSEWWACLVHSETNLTFINLICLLFLLGQWCQLLFYRLSSNAGRSQIGNLRHKLSLQRQQISMMIMNFCVFLDILYMTLFMLYLFCLFVLSLQCLILLCHCSWYNVFCFFLSLVFTEFHTMLLNLSQIVLSWSGLQWNWRPFQEYLVWRQEHTLNGMQINHSEPCTHIHTLFHANWQFNVVSPPTGMCGVGRNMTKTSGTYQGPSSYEVTMYHCYYQFNYNKCSFKHTTIH